MKNWIKMGTLILRYWWNGQTWRGAYLKAKADMSVARSVKIISAALKRMEDAIDNLPKKEK